MHFTEPSGLFIFLIPDGWKYTSVSLGYEEKSPFDFISKNKKLTGGFQLSCFPATETEKIKTKQTANKSNLRFFEQSPVYNDDTVFKIWYCAVEDHIFLAKYIYPLQDKDSSLVLCEIQKAKAALKTLILIPEKDRRLAADLDKYDRFLISLFASFDLKAQALKSGAFIELLVILANQIDAYLRLSIVLTKQLANKSDDFDVKYFHQSDTDNAISERSIYKESFALSIISKEAFDKLESRRFQASSATPK